MARALLIRIACIMVALCQAPAALAQVTYYVRASGNNTNNGMAPQSAFATIAKAASVASAGDTIYVGAGSYSGQVSPVNSGTSGSPIRFIADTTGAFTGDSGTVTIPAGTGAYAILVSQKDYIEFHGFNVTGSSVAAVYWYLSTGGVLNGVTIPSGTGGGVTAAGSTLTIRACNIYNSLGDGVYIRKSGTTNSNVTITDSSIHDMSTSAFVPINTGDTSTITVTGCDLYNYLDDGISINGAGPTITVDRTKFRNGLDGIWMGAAATLTVTNSLFATMTQQGIELEANASNSATITNCTFYNCQLDAVWVKGGTANVRNCIVSNSGRYGLYRTGGTLSNSYNLMYSNATANYQGVTAGTGALTGNPLFVNAASGDFRLQSGSPAINAGNSTLAMYYDILYLARNWQPCLGAYERYSQSPASLPYSTTFDAGVAGEWSYSANTTYSGGVGTVAGPYSLASTPPGQQNLMVSTTAGTSYIVYFDFVLLDWNNEPMNVYANGKLIWSYRPESASGGIDKFPAARYTYNPGTSITTDKIYKQAWARFTADASYTFITFRSDPTTSVASRNFALDNVSVRTFAFPTVSASSGYTCDFSTVPGPEWSRQDSINDTNFGFMGGRFGMPNYGGSQDNTQLTLNVSSGTTYYVAFDLYLIDSWDGNDTTWGPDYLRVYVNGTQVLSETFACWDYQSYPFNPEYAYADLGYSSSYNDTLYRRVWFSFTAGSSVARIRWTTQLDGDLTDESYALDNVVVRAAGDPSLFNTQSPGGALVNSMPRFRDISSSSGFSISSDSSNINSTGGVHVCDFNGDGLQDILVDGGSAGSYLMQTSITSGSLSFTSRLVSATGKARYATILDFDRNGVPDLYGSSGWGASPTFIRTQVSSGVPSFGDVGNGGLSGVAYGFTLAGIDADANGANDIAALVYGASNVCGINGTTTVGVPAFTLDSSKLPNGAGDWGSGLYAATADINADGVPDIFYNVGTGRLFLSNATTRTWTTSSRGLNVSSTAQTAAWGDFNNDGNQDLFVTNRSGDGSPGALYRNPGGSGNFVNVNNATAAATAGLPYAGITDTGVQCSACWGDFDNDGYLDLMLVGQGYCTLWRNNGDGTSTKSFQGCSVEGDPTDAVFADLDNDGDLDLIVTGSWGTERVFENLSNLIAANTNYVKVRVMAKDPSGNFTLPDARCRVELWNAAGTTLLQVRDIGAQRGYGSEPFWAHFGGVAPGTTYTVKVLHAGGTATQTVVPSAASTTIGSRTIAQMLTVNITPARPKIASWTDVNPN